MCAVSRCTAEHVRPPSCAAVTSTIANRTAHRLRCAMCEECRPALAPCAAPCYLRCRDDNVERAWRSQPGPLALSPQTPKADAPRDELQDLRRLPVSAISDGDGRHDTLSDNDASLSANPGVTPPDTGDDGRDVLAAPATITRPCTSIPVAVRHTVACPPQPHDRLRQTNLPASEAGLALTRFYFTLKSRLYGGAASVVTPERT